MSAESTLNTSRVYAACAVLLLGAAFLFSGCKGSGETAGSTVPPAPSEQAREKALQHFIDGSLYEVKGDYAQAVLEFQDALRLDPNHAVFYALSRSYSRLGKQALAIDAGKESVRRAPENTEYLRNLGDIYASAFQIDSAAATYERVVRRDSTDIQAWFTLANLYQGRKPLKALEIYESITARFGEEWDVLMQIAELYSAMGESEKAIAALEKMLALDPGNLELKRSLAQTCVRAQQFDKALRLYDELLEVDPGNLDYLGESATVHLLNKDYRAAAEMFELVLARDSVSVEAKLRIGETYFAQLQSDSSLTSVARSMFERIRDRHRDDWRPYWFLGAIGSITNDDSLTVTSFRRVTELAPWNPDGWGFLASAYLQRERFEDAVRVLEEGLQHVPDDYQINLYLGIAYNRLQRNDEAINALEKASRLNPRDLRALTQLALIYDARSDLAASDSLYEEALTIEPGNHLVLNNYSYSLAERGIQLERALEMAKRAVEAQPDNPSYLDTIGWVYFKLGNYAEAEKYIKQSLAAGEPSAVVLEHLGDIYFMADKKDLALEQWNKALKLDEGNESLREKISRGGL